MEERAWEGTLEASFQMMGRVSLGVNLDGYPDVRDSNTFLEGLRGKRVRVLVQEVDV
jgi:hypothetical protein